MGDFQNYGPFLGPYSNTGPNVGDPKRDHTFDNLPYKDNEKDSGNYYLGFREVDKIWLWVY